MKARCPANCGREVGTAHILCNECWSDVPVELRNAVSRAPLIIRNSIGAVAVKAAFEKQRLARQRAIQWAIDKQNNKQKVSA